MHEQHDIIELSIELSYFTGNSDNNNNNANVHGAVIMALPL